MNENNIKEFYFDNTATTKVLPEVVEAVVETLTNNYGNPSALHKKGWEAHKSLKEARNRIAKTLGAEDDEIYFTSGGSESNNLALRGLAQSYKKQGNHIISTAVEHAAILETLKDLEKEGFEVTILPVNKFCQIDIEQLKAAIKPTTILVSTMLVNNEVGTITDVGAIGKMLATADHKIYYHVDAVQGYGKVKINPKKMGIDMLSVSGHKLHAPKGSGFLYVKKGVRVAAIITGGGQEKGMRSGTENTPAQIGLGVAAKIANGEIPKRKEHILAVRTAFLEGLAELEDWKINGMESGDDTLPYLLNIGFKGTKSEVLLHSLEEEGIYVSSGSACSSKGHNLSKVLLAMGLPEAEIEGALRFSFSINNSVEDATEAAKIVVKKVRELRKVLR